MDRVSVDEAAKEVEGWLRSSQVVEGADPNPSEDVIRHIRPILLAATGISGNTLVTSDSYHAANGLQSGLRRVLKG